MQRKLLLLGLLRDQEMHAYQLNELIEPELAASVQLTKPTIYRLLEQMADDGWISASEEQEGSRPTRRVYRVMPQGEIAFQQVLRDSLSAVSPPQFPSATGLAFLSELPAGEAAALLRERQRLIRESLRPVPDREERRHLSHLVELSACYQEAELRWLHQLIARLEGLRAAPTAPPPHGVRELIPTASDTRQPSRPIPRKIPWSPEID